jgi:hypothetical protein
MKRELLNRRLNLLPIWLDSWLSLPTYNGLEQSLPRSSSRQRSAFSLAADADTRQGVAPLGGGSEADGPYSTIYQLRDRRQRRAKQAMAS